MNFLRHVIVIPEKLTAWAAAGLLYLMVQFTIWLTNVTGIDFTGLPMQALAVAVAVVLSMLLKGVMEAYVPESWHNTINTFLEWLASIVVVSMLYNALK